MSPLRPNAIPDKQLISNSKSTSTSTTTTPTQSRIVPQLPSPPETLDSTSQSPIRPTSSLSTDNDPSSSQSYTPQRGRTDSRYPATLGPGRVPLHRRGNSKTYERLEDLLREAGYKETRVFTPETERAEAEAEERKEKELRRGQSGSVRDGVGAVVGFLAGLVSRTPSLVRDAGAGRRAGSPSGSRTTPLLQQEYSPPPSPLAHKPQSKSKCTSISSHPYSASPTTPTFTSSAESLTRSPRGSSSNINPTYRITSPNSTSDLTPRATLRGSNSYSHVHGNTRPSRLRPQPSFSSNQMPQTYAQASKARAYLRHMASAPSIQPSSNNSRPALVRHSSSRYAGSGSGYGKRRTMVLDDGDADGEGDYVGRRGNGEGEDENEIHGRPPLPRTWLENVARAVLFGGTGVDAGVPSHSPSRPSQSHSQSPKSRLEALRMSPASSTKSALSDHTNTPQALVLKGRAPPFLCAQVAAHRTPSETRVSRTRVVCRSAPASRSGSRVRGGRNIDVEVDVKSKVGKGKEEGDGFTKGKERSKARKEGRGKGRGREKDGVPSLARTHAQNDGWSNLKVGDGEMCTSSSEEEDEGELDLTRLLVPPKRQNSIRSLRRHLHEPLPPTFIQSITSSSSTQNGPSRATGDVRGREGSKKGEWDHDHRGNDEDGDEDWRRGMLGGGRSSLSARHGRGMKGEEEMFEGLFFGGETSGSGAGTKKRRGIHGTWATGS